MLQRKELLEKNLPILLSYLKASISKEVSNKIYTVPNKDVQVNIKGKSFTIKKRSPNIGLSQFSFFVMEDKNGINYTPKQYNIRVENNVFSNKLSIIATKIEDLRKSDLLVFGDESFFYVSKANKFGYHEWLDDDNYYRLIVASGPHGKYTCYEYDIYKLLSDKKITGISYRSECNDVISYTGPIFNDAENTLVERKEYKFDVYAKELAQLSKLFIQNDPRKAAVIYYCYFGSRYTNRYGTIPEIAAELCSWCCKSKETLVRQQLYRAKRLTNNTGKANYVEFQLDDKKAEQLRNNINFDSSCITEDNKIIIFLSNEKNFDVIENAKIKKTENMKEYQKEYGNHYRKVKKWIKENPGNMNFPKKWTEDDIEIAKTIVLTI